MLSAPAFSQDNSDDWEYDKQWIGGFGTLYKPSEEKMSSGIADDGKGLGLEYGYRFDKNWAARVELSALDMDYKAGSALDDESGSMVGVDAMYFMPGDLLYLFGGIKHQNLDDNYTLGNIGIGKHWRLGESRVRLITEVAAYQDLEESYNDYSFKLGLSVPFGGSGSSSTSSNSNTGTLDADNDGVANRNDRCPNTPAGAQVDANGCAMDNDEDQDGVVNSADQCPNTPRGADVNAQGCEIKDSDMDGVSDANDQCADTPRDDKVDAQGCTIFDEEEVSMTLRVLFDRESAVVKQPNDPEIQALADFMKRFGNISATIEGHTSAPGSEEYNMKLSQERADAFKEVMVDRYGIDASRLDTKGYGETQLLDTDNDAEANRVNRRISVSIREIVKVPEERE